jgi:hypothetical protein
LSGTQSNLFRILRKKAGAGIQPGFGMQVEYQKCPTLKASFSVENQGFKFRQKKVWK